VHRVLGEDEVRAREIIFRYVDKDFSYVDATSFAVMERLGIEEALTLDNHFRQYGWRVLPERLN
jgi:predicted nucleic acid-binding protein